MSEGESEKRENLRLLFPYALCSPACSAIMAASEAAQALRGHSQVSISYSTHTTALGCGKIIEATEWNDDMIFSSTRYLTRPK